jgi:hypothetical protein
MADSGQSAAASEKRRATVEEGGGGERKRQRVAKACLVCRHKRIKVRLAKVSLYMRLLGSLAVFRQACVP